MSLLLRKRPELLASVTLPSEYSQQCLTGSYSSDERRLLVMLCPRVMFNFQMETKGGRTFNTTRALTGRELSISSGASGTSLVGSLLALSEFCSGLCY